MNTLKLTLIIIFGTCGLAYFIWASIRITQGIRREIKEVKKVMRDYKNDK